MPESGNAGSWGRLILSLLRNHHAGVQIGYTSLHSHQQWRSVPFTPHSLEHNLSLVLLILANLTGVMLHPRLSHQCSRNADWMDCCHRIGICASQSYIPGCPLAINCGHDATWSCYLHWLDLLSLEPYICLFPCLCVLCDSCILLTDQTIPGSYGYKQDCWGHFELCPTIH